jgi:hypothetical protein
VVVVVPVAKTVAVGLPKPKRTVRSSTVATDDIPAMSCAIGDL